MRTKGKGERDIDSMYMRDRDIVIAQLLGTLLVLCQISVMDRELLSRTSANVIAALASIQPWEYTPP